MTVIVGYLALANCFPGVPGFAIVQICLFSPPTYMHHDTRHIDRGRDSEREREARQENTIAGSFFVWQGEEKAQHAVHTCSLTSVQINHTKRRTTTCRLSFGCAAQRNTPKVSLVFRKQPRESSEPWHLSSKRAAPDKHNPTAFGGKQPSVAFQLRSKISSKRALKPNVGPRAT